MGTSTLTAGGVYVWKIQNAGPYSSLYDAIKNTGLSSTGTGKQDLLAVNGNLTWTSPVIDIVGLTGNGFDPNMAYSWTLATFGGTGSVTNPGFQVDGLAALASQFNLSVTGGAVILNYSPVPEPSCVLLLAAAGAGAVGLLRRRSGRRVNRAL